ncbi:MAG TPA: hypothetical protein DCY20_01490 [Firmicutes bacterium]|nr:hypothetical protein [Bacillota bacterium]
MRVTNNMMTSSQTKAISQNLTKYHQISEQLNSGKLITKPSQNPYFTTKIMGYKQEISQKEQYQRNIDHATTLMNEADSSLSEINSVMLRIKELTTQAANDTTSIEDKQAMATEIEQLKKTIQDSLDKKVNDKPVFAKSDADVQNVEISSSSSVDCNMYYDDVTGSNPDIFETLDKLIETLNDPDATSEDITTISEQLTQHENQILSVRTKVGAVTNRLDVAKDRNENEITTLGSLLSNIEDVDYAEKIIELTAAEVAYSASLQVSASMMQQSLLDFLR